MVHAITSLKCEKGHILPISFDSNECGCHHNGKPCIIVTCNECLTEWLLDRKENRTPSNDNMREILIPLDEDGMEEIKKLK